MKRTEKRPRDEQGRFLSKEALQEDLQTTWLESLNFAQELIAAEIDELVDKR